GLRDAASRLLRPGMTRLEGFGQSLAFALISRKGTVKIVPVDKRQLSKSLCSATSLTGLVKRTAFPPRPI
ncbi:hypothetical protein, partial [Mesorhizobium sp.]|uniref:hypothetical protein n=1 Tax=Mesorhizobium sp. TaxID=1871066 RepID=UPI0025C08CDC